MPAREHSSLSVNPALLARRSISSGVRSSSIKPHDMCISAPKSSALLQGDAVLRACKDAHMTDPDLERARRQIFAVMAETGLNANQLAEAAHLAHTTITRPLYNPDWAFVPSTRTMSKIMSVAARSRLMSDNGPPAPVAQPKRRAKRQRSSPQNTPKKGLR